MNGKRHRVMKVTIRDKGQVDYIDAAHLEPEHVMVFIVSNEDTVTGATYTLSIDPKAIVLKGTNTATNPFAQTTVLLAVVAPGDEDVIRLKVKAAAAFIPNGGALPYTTYEYTVSMASSLKRGVKKIDPDFDIAPPN